MKKVFLTRILPLFIVGFLWSCDDDFTSTGKDIVGEGDINITKYTVQNIAAYNRANGAVQSNNLPINGLGVINNPVFGKTVTSFVTQLELVSGSNPVADITNAAVTKVELTIPYFSKLKETDSEGNRTYILDSLVTSNNAKFRLNIYESGYYLRDFDPSTNFEEAQKYYSDMYAAIDAAKIGNRLNDSDQAAQNDQFFFDPSEIKIYETNEDGEEVLKERLEPQMRIELNKAFFQQKIFNAPAGQMDNNNTFKNYFKGLFFQVEDLGLGNHFAQLDFSKGEITITYTTPSTDDEESEQGTVKLNLKGNTVSLMENQYFGNYLAALTSANPTTGDEKLYIKGGEGSVAYIDIFNDVDSDGNGISDELEALRTQAKEESWLINEANLVFYIDQSQMNNNSLVPQRIYIFDAEKNIPLFDYWNDQTTVSGYPKLKKYIHGGILEYDSDGKGVKYKIRLTQHIKSLLLSDEPKNVKLGISVTEAIDIIAPAALKDGVSFPNDSPYRYVPFASVMHPFGTVLYGNNTNDEEKKLKLEILYTKP